jgi:hypothetical protein
MEMKEKIHFGDNERRESVSDDPFESNLARARLIRIIPVLGLFSSCSSKRYPR